MMPDIGFVHWFPFCRILMITVAHDFCTYVPAYDAIDV